jgi:hypothetical protein
MKSSSYRVITLRYAGVCASCGVSVDAGARAWWRPGQKLVTCITCQPEVEANTAFPADDEAASGVLLGGSTTAPLSAATRASLDPGVAGASSMREYQRRHDQRMARISERWGRLSGLVATLTSDPATTLAWQRGSIGESKLAAALGQIDREDVVFLNDRRVPGREATSTTS